MADGPLLLQLILRCATDLKNVNLLSKMEVFALVSISGDSDKNKVKTPTDRSGGSNPTWDFPIRLAVDETALQQNRLTLHFKLVCERALGDKGVGHVHVSLKDLLDSSPGPNGGWSFVSYQVTKPSGRPKGHLTFSYKFNDQSTVDEQPPPPPTTEMICRRSPAAYPVVDLDSEVLEEATAKLDFNRTVYPPPGKISEEPTTATAAAYPVMELEAKSVYPPLGELNSNSVYPPKAQTYLEPTAARSAVEFHSRTVYPPVDVCQEPTAVGLDSNFVYPPPTKVYRELSTTLYPSLEFDSNSCVYPPAAKVYKEPMAVYPLAPASVRHRYTPLYPAIEGLKGGYPLLYGYPPPATAAAGFYVYPAVSGRTNLTWKRLVES